MQAKHDLRVKLKIGITGPSGFIGTHLIRALQQESAGFRVVPFFNYFFKEPESLGRFVAECDVIVHLACVNRHPDLRILYDTNLDLTKSLVDAMKQKQVAPAVLYSSSIRETETGLYGRAKLDCGTLLEKWAAGSGAAYRKLIIPNVFGPGAKPYDNSFIATFCHQLIHGQECIVTENREIPLIYIETLCGKLIASIRQAIDGEAGHGKTGNNLVTPDFRMRVGDVLRILREFMTEIECNGRLITPEDPNLANLQSTFLSYF